MNSKEIMPEEVYERAEEFLPWNAYKLTFNTHIQPNWIEKTDKFWYVSKTQQEKRFFLVDPEKKIKEDAFDHVKLAKSLSETSSRTRDHKNFPFDEIKFIEEENDIQFDIKKSRYIFDLETYKCKDKTKKEFDPQGELKSPDNNWTALVKNHNIFIRSLSTGEEFQLTDDGEKWNEYGTLPESSTFEITIRRMGLKLPPIALWSPDSKKLVVHKMDQRKVKQMHLIQSVGLGKSSRPILHSYRYPLPEDEVITQSELVVLDIEKKSKVVAKYKPQDISYVPPIFFKYVWWSKDSKYIYYIYIERNFKTGRFIEVNAETGDTRVIIEEKIGTQIDLNHLIGSPPNVKVLETSKEVIWFSQRDGWGHLYLYDGNTGDLKNQITSGEWLVRDIMHVDEKDRWIYFLAGGKEKNRDPYFRHLYRASLDGTRIELLTPEDADHDVEFSPTGNYFVDNFSSVNTAPTSVVRSVDGQLILNLEIADLSLLRELGWNLPTQFKLKARDGTTDIYGVMFYPSSFNSSKKYPVIDAIYPGPQVIKTPKQFPQKIDRSLNNFWGPQAMAELGFIVVTVDGIGTPLRSKKFHDFSYGNLGDGGGLEDHVAAFKQLKKDYPYMDLDSVGIFGHSGGGFASTRAILAFPDFYNVAVSSAGNHDQRGYVADWGNKYQGMLKGNNYDNQINAKLAKNLKGKLLLACGDLDDNVHPALTYQLIDALIKANKDFDMIVLPNRNHLFAMDGYFIRKRMDYFVQHLLHLTPPKEYKIKGPPMEFVMKMFMF